MKTFAEIKSSLPKEALLKMPALPFNHKASGKVREIYDLGENLLIIATDRLSAFDVILPNGIPGKGILLNQLSLHWFKRTESIMDNHLVPNHDAAVAELLKDFPELIDRSMLVKKLKSLPVEAIVRAYLSGSGWKEYQKTGKLFEYALPETLKDSSKLPEPLFTPTTKAAVGDHDMPITQAETAQLLGDDMFRQVKEASLKLFAVGCEYAKKSGLILADTKFEFGVDANNKLYVIDEVLTPDSSRYWLASDYEEGRAQASFDKQYVRDYLETLDWNKKAPGPELPAEVIQNTQSKYLEALRYLIG